MANQTLTVWQQITVEFNGHSLTGSYAMENGIVKVKTPFGEKADPSSPFNSEWVARRLLEELAAEGKEESGRLIINRSASALEAAISSIAYSTNRPQSDVTGRRSSILSRRQFNQDAMSLRVQG